MATVLKMDGLRVVIYSNDHRPEHVHVIGAGLEAVFELNCPKGLVALRETYGFGTAQLRTLTQRLTFAVAALCRAWEEIHGID